MNTLLDVEGYSDKVVKICPNGTVGDIIELSGVHIALPKPPKRGIKGEGLEASMQVWERVPMPKELSRIRSMDEWARGPERVSREISSIYRRRV